MCIYIRYICIFTNIDILFDFITVFSDIYHELFLRTVFFSHKTRLPMTAFSFARKPLSMLK